MKKIAIILMLCIGFTIAPTQKSHAIVWMVFTTAIKKVVRAIDLQIQRQQNKIIWLQNAQKTIENTMAKLKLNEISDWSEKQQELYKDYYQELWKVKNVVFTYQKLKRIAEQQMQLVTEFKSAWGMLSKDKNFTAQELEQMYQTYLGILDESLKNVDQLRLIVNSFYTQMSDGKRLELIAISDKNLEQNLLDMRRFNAHNKGLSRARTMQQKELEMMRQLNGVDQ